MVEVTLRQYCEEIESLIDQGSYDAAISHCQHILKIYPKHLRVYRLMGKTALEMGDLEAAADLFSRLLSMDPEDFVARVGMSIASDKEGSLDQAIWHIERAFELAPDNQAIVAELRRLYGRRDGVEPEKIPLTQAALARLHARGELYTQAINELRELLEAEPGRVDLQISLAETLWRANRRIEAAEASLAILEKLPYCLKANLILGEIWSSSGREEEGAAHLDRAQTIDPENEIAQALFGERSPLPAAEVNVGRMEYVAPPAVEEQEPDWLQTLIDEGTSAVESDEAVPDWLQAVAASAEEKAEIPTETAAPATVPMPEWLEEVAETAGAEAEELAAAPEIPVPEPEEGETPDWLAQLTAEPTEIGAEPSAPEEITDQLEEVPAEAVEEPEALPEEIAEFGAEEAPSEVPEVEAPEAMPDELPDWLAEMPPVEAEPTGLEEPEPATEELPEWLSDMEPAEAPEIGEPELAADEMPEWLTDMAPAEGEPSEAEDVDLAPAEIPDWLSEMAPPETTTADVPELDVEPTPAPDWLAAEGPIAAERPEAEPEEEEEELALPSAAAAETADWLSELVEAAGASMEEEEQPTELPPELEEEAMPEWLGDLEEEPEEEVLVHSEVTAAEAADSEAELLAKLEDMSPEEAFAAWEAMLAESEEEEEVVAVEPEAELPETPRSAGPILIEEPEKETLVYPEDAGGEVSESEAELLAQLEEMSPEEAFAAWEAMLAESEEQAPVEEAPPAEMVIEEEEAWMPLAEDEELEEIETLAVAEAAPSLEPEAEEEVPADIAADLDQPWMSLVEDIMEEAAAPVEPEEVPAAEPVSELEIEEITAAVEPEAEAEIEIEPEEEAIEPPEPAVPEAIEALEEIPPEEEVELEIGPEWVLLTEEEEAEIRLTEERVTAESREVSEPSVELMEPDEEEVALPGEEPLVEVEPPARPTWVALEEEAAEEAIEEEAEEPAVEVAVEEEVRVEVPVAEAAPVDERAVPPDDDQARLELARRLWDEGQRDGARAEYENLVKSGLRDKVIADLEKLTAEGPPEEPMLRVLGDAYMRNNQLQKALDTYRRALASLKTYTA